MLKRIRWTQRRPGANRCLLRQCVRYQSRTHYDVLGVKRNATQAEVRAAFLDMSKKLHPDTNSEDPTTHDKFVKLNDAYTILSKQLTRQEYDQNLARQLGMTNSSGLRHYRPGQAPYSQSGFSDMNYTNKGSYYYPNAEERAKNIRDEIHWKRDPSKSKRKKVPLSLHMMGVLFILTFSFVMYLKEIYFTQVYFRAQAERMKWKDYDAFADVSHIRKSRTVVSKKQTFALIFVLYCIGILLGLNVYYKSHRIQQYHSFSKAIGIRERRRAGKSISNYDTNIETFYRKELDQRDAKLAEQMKS